MSDRASRKVRVGIVISDKMDKTIVVKAESLKKHPLYKKMIKQTKKYHAHDEDNTSGVGDTVKIMETRPVSLTKRWRLVEIVEKAK